VVNDPIKKREQRQARKGMQEEVDNEDDMGIDNLELE
jgi:hypothetical protein